MTFTTVFRAVGAPDWHGRNLNALRDSIAGGDINEVEVPYRLIVTNYDQIAPQAKKMADDFIDLIKELAAEGRLVEIRAERQCIMREGPRKYLVEDCWVAEGS
jgi:hypothetical protein